jgi:circadian clock protein KaiC
MQFLVKGTDAGDNGLYITFEEEKENLLGNMKAFSWKLSDLEKSKKLNILEMTPEEVKKAVEKNSLGLKFTVVKAMKVSRIVIDSLTAYLLLFEDGLKRREAMRSLFKVLRGFGCTCILIAERELDFAGHQVTADLSEFEVDSVISFYNQRKSDIRERFMEVKKIRGTKNLPKLFPMQISEKGVDIYPEQALF